MNSKEIEDYETKRVWEIAKSRGAKVSKTAVQIVLDAYVDFIEQELPDIDEHELNNFIIDNLAFDVDGSGNVDDKLLKRISALHMEFLASKGILPEDWNDDHEDE